MEKLVIIKIEKQPLKKSKRKRWVFMDCLAFAPVVFVIGKDYEIGVFAKENGLIWVEIDGVKYYEENSGALSTEKRFTKIRISQEILNTAKAYTVVYRKTIDRKAYYSELGEEERKVYAFKPIEKTDNINAYHIADVHYRFALAKQTARFFGDDLDLFIVNGDIGEVETYQNYEEVYEFMADITGGEIPVLFVRGNHDTRGKLAEKFSEYYPCENKKHYFPFEIGCLNGVALDCGEDKWDNCKEYGGVNDFEGYRKGESAFLEALQLDQNKINFVVSHVCPSQTTLSNPLFAIETDRYTAWNEEFKRLGVKFMICGHMHRAYMLTPYDEKCTAKNNSYPVAVASACYEDDLWGGAFVIGKESLTVAFTDKNCVEREKYSVDYKTGNVERLF